MIGALTTYGALSAKVRAMYGRRLRAADFRRIAAMKSLEEVLDFLREHPGWQQAVEQIDTRDIRRSVLESVLKGHTMDEYLRLAAFIPKGDRPLSGFSILLAEEEAILHTLRRLRAGRVHEDRIPPSLLRKGKVDTDGLRSCVTYDGLLHAVKDSIFYQPLMRLRPAEPDGLPDYPAAEALLRSTYFSYIYRQISKNYAGETKAVLLRSFGEQVDLLNIIHILRMKRYFPHSADCLTVLLPFYHRLRPETIQALRAAPTLEAAMALLAGTPYAGAFRDLDVAAVEDYYRMAFYRFNHRQLMLGAPSIYCAIAYLNLRELETSALITAIESVKYGVPYDDSFTSLMGD